MNAPAEHYAHHAHEEDTMRMTLAVRTYQGAAPDAPLACGFGTAGGTIGRGPDSTMVLPDALKTVSRVQARIDWSEDGWRLTDLGSNPSRLNGRPLAAARPARLANGDRLEIGGYRLEVRTVERAVADGFDAPPGVHDERVFDPLASAGAAALSGDPLAHAAVLSGSPVPGAMFDPLGTPADAARRHALRPGGRAAFAGSESDHVPPEQFAWMPPAAAAAGIPHDYDPLQDEPFVPQRPEPVSASMELSGERSLQPAVPEMARTAPATDDPTLNALLEGLGIDASALRERSATELARLAGTMLRTAVRGAVDVLLSRSVLKREVRLDTTLLLQRDNNPLKFFPDGDSALQQMLAGRSGGYLPAQTALQGAFDDIRRHELAVLGGMRAAIQHLLGRFDPQAIAVAETAHHWLDWLPACRKARQWDRLVALHRELTRASADDLQALCGSAFNDAYERQAGLMSGGEPQTFTHTQRDDNVLE
ncbi:FHA-family protein [Caballeronia arationis]|jgi:FHA domain-containing protein/type VI secretion system protein|uniref:type VI secretion system-associated FHA domain protein TagH n=1 Tax=Caballeronia arationis TaxID=1777142 RepID=UPI00074CCA54|nr:type VI secretion system-associated FHA domain protein TagH [Caballeronia arationis]SAK86237.1 FHA-family protein [Caballeronia arationis]